MIIVIMPFFMTYELFVLCVHCVCWLYMLQDPS